LNGKRIASTCLAGLALAATAAFLLSGCGESKEEKAHDKACDAVADINTQVKQLQSYTLATVTSDKVSNNLDTIQQDVSDIKSALPDLSSSLKSQLSSATDTFSSKLSSVIDTLGQSTSVQSAATQINAAADQLAAGYREAFARVSC
jgi:uncharacterized phage infection (PIP) family protein YhgE